LLGDELRLLYTADFGSSQYLTQEMINAFAAAELPTQLISDLSALAMHGSELVSLRYFSLDDTGAIRYLSDDDVAQAPDPLSGRVKKYRGLFANAELQFRKPGGRIQTHRHIQVNLDDNHLNEDPRVLRHLEAKRPIAAMTKAATYLLSWNAFSRIRDYLTKHVVWMVSDTTGVAPKWGKAAGFEYETYGSFARAYLEVGHTISADWHGEWQAQTS